MSTPPPPYSGYPAPGPVLPMDRRTARTQRKAAETQARRQRDQVRLQMRAMQRRSVTGPVLLVAVGIILLLVQDGRLHWGNLLLWLSLWWPAILICAGLLMLLEWAMDRQRSRAVGTAPPRRILGGAAATFLVLLALVGAGLMAIHRSSNWLPGDGWGQGRFLPEDLNDQLTRLGGGDWRQLFGVHSEFTNDLQDTLAPGGELTIDDPRGDVVVTGASVDGQVHVSVRQHLVNWQHENNDDLQQREKPRFSGTREHLVLSSSPQGQDDADLTIQLPHEASVVIRSGHGDVSVEEVHGSATVLAHDGDVKVTAVRGPVKLTTNDDDATVTAHSLGDGLTLDGRSGDLDLSDIQGGLTLHGDFFGTTQMQRIRGAVAFQSSFTHLSCAGIPGSLIIEGRSDMTGQHLEGPLTIATTDRNLSLDGVRGSSTITNRNGSVTMTVASPLQPLHISDVNGAIELSVPEHQAFSLHAQTRDAEIQDDFGFAAKTTGEAATVEGSVLSGGPRFDLESTEDEIRIHKVSTAADTAWSKDAPKPELHSPAEQAKPQKRTPHHS